MAISSRYKYCIVIFLFCVSSINASVRVQEKMNSTELIRNRRFLIYPVNGGTLKVYIEKPFSYNVYRKLEYSFVLNFISKIVDRF